MPARNGPMATAGRLLLPPTPPKAPQVPHGVPGTHTPHWGFIKAKKRGKWQKTAENGPIPTYPACAQAGPGAPDSNAPNEGSTGS